jgi:hypothetical protein
MVDTQLPGVRMECWLKSPWLARSYIHKQYSYRPGKKPSCWGCRYATSNGRKDSEKSRLSCVYRRVHIYGYDPMD